MVDVEELAGGDVYMETDDRCCLQCCCQSLLLNPSSFCSLPDESPEAEGIQRLISLSCFSTLQSRSLCLLRGMPRANVAAKPAAAFVKYPVTNSSQWYGALLF